MIIPTPPIVYDNCKGCKSKCEHAGKDREFVCIKGVSCKVTESAPKTTFDRIKNMSVEEMAEFIKTVSYHCSAMAHENECCGCRQPYCEREDLIKWLESEDNSND